MFNGIQTTRDNGKLQIVEISTILNKISSKYFEKKFLVAILSHNF